jgi:hypothetical protein
MTAYYICLCSRRRVALCDAQSAQYVALNVYVSAQDSASARDAPQVQRVNFARAANRWRARCRRSFSRLAATPHPEHVDPRPCRRASCSDRASSTRARPSPCSNRRTRNIGIGSHGRTHSRDPREAAEEVPHSQVARADEVSLPSGDPSPSRGTSPRRHRAHRRTTGPRQARPGWPPRGRGARPPSTSRHVARDRAAELGLTDTTSNPAAVALEGRALREELRPVVRPRDTMIPMGSGVVVLGRHVVRRLSLTATVPLVDAMTTRFTPASAHASSTFFVPSTCRRYSSSASPGSRETLPAQWNAPSHPCPPPRDTAPRRARRPRLSRERHRVPSPSSAARGACPGSPSRP